MGRLKGREMVDNKTREEIQREARDAIKEMERTLKDYLAVNSARMFFEAKQKLQNVQFRCAQLGHPGREYIRARGEKRYYKCNDCLAKFNEKRETTKELHEA